MTREIWEEYKNLHCNENISFKKCILPSLMSSEYPKYNIKADHHLFASSPSAYLLFHKLFDRYFEQRKIKQAQTNFRDFNVASYKELKEEDISFVKSLKIQNHCRNLVGYPFTHELLPSQKEEIISLIQKVFSQNHYQTREFSFEENEDLAQFDLVKRYMHGKTQFSEIYKRNGPPSFL